MSGPKGGEHRKQIYSMFESITGRKITEKEHAMLRAILVDLVTTHPRIERVDHIYTCLHCKKETPLSKPQRERANKQSEHKIISKQLTPPVSADDVE